MPLVMACFGSLLLAQNVGIGTSSPTSRLHVAGTNATLTVGPFGIGQAEGRIIATGAVAEVSFVRRSLTSWPAAPVAGDRFVWYNPNGSARLWTEANGDLVTVTAGGNVGIGQTNPAGRLTIRSGWSNWIQLEDNLVGNPVLLP